jgi:hypothetical protein
MVGASSLQATPARIIWLAPLLFLLHVAEEAPGFVVWFNSLVRNGITQQSFLMVNASAFLITVFVAILLGTTKEKGAALLCCLWLSFLMFANAILHLAGTAVLGRYSPGAITSAALYLPYFAWFLWLVIRQFKLGPIAVMMTVVLGSLPMLIHGYLIVFEGRRLF